MAAVHTLDESRFGYLKQADVARLADAYRFSEAAHKGQTRQSGDPYISHPLAVAETLAQVRALGVRTPAEVTAMIRADRDGR